MIPRRPVWMLSLALLPAPAAATPLPEPVAAMIAAALDSGDDAQIKAVVDVARKTNPDSSGEIDALIAPRLAAKAEADRVRKAAEASARPTAQFKGEVEFGASRSTGNSDTLGLFGSTSLRQESVRWRHQFAGRAEVQETDGVRTTERFLASWQPGYKFDAHHYAYGLAQYEHDRFLGYTDRFTGGAGLGLVLSRSPRFSLEVEGGPAVRYTRYVDDGGETDLAGRASLSARWQASPTLLLTQKAAVYLQSGDTNASSISAVEATLIGPFKGRLSYQLLYERDAPPDRDKVDTLSRATLVYSF